MVSPFVPCEVEWRSNARRYDDSKERRVFFSDSPLRGLLLLRPFWHKFERIMYNMLRGFLSFFYLVLILVDLLAMALGTV
jgi:hypothetical protein